MKWLDRSMVLTFEEIERVARILVAQSGIESIRLTGGEPLIRAHCSHLVARLGALHTPDGDAVEVSLTTNGALLAAHAEALAEAGLARVNVSLDTLMADRFLATTKRDDLESVIAGIVAARAAGLHPVKVNCVVVRGTNEDEVEAMAAFGRVQGVTMRFIEFMPLDGDHAWRTESVVSCAEIFGRINSIFPLEPIASGSSPAQRFRYVDGRGEVGIIPTVTEPFCGSCDRIRLSAEGGLRSCLFGLEEFDLRGPLRSGATDEDLLQIVAEAVATKWAGHGVGNVNFIRPRKSMSQIGG